MVLFGGFADQVEQHVGNAGDNAATFGGKVMDFVDHYTHELENGDVMTWVSFVAVVLAILLLVLAWRGNLAALVLAFKGRGRDGS